MPKRNDTLGDYVIERVIGEGAAGTVFLAHDARQGRSLALKVFTPQVGLAETERAELRQRFLLEADIARRLQHPDIVSIVDAGETRGLLWLAMERVHGHTLERWLQPGLLLAPEVAVRIVIRVAHALAHAHRQGVVHRDLKPSNVLVDLETQTVKLTDFGTARVLDANRTRTELMLGTPAYMAPELLAGSAASAASDLYALGVLLFELLTGRRPHESSSMGELLRRVATEAAPDVRALRPELPATLAAPLARMLKKRVTERTRSADAAAAELTAALAQWPLATQVETACGNAG